MNSPVSRTKLLIVKLLRHDVDGHTVKALCEPASVPAAKDYDASLQVHALQEKLLFNLDLLPRQALLSPDPTNADLLRTMGEVSAEEWAVVGIAMLIDLTMQFSWNRQKIWKDDVEEV